jgi:hypothetical protein
MEALAGEGGGAQDAITFRGLVHTVVPFCTTRDSQVPTCRKQISIYPIGRSETGGSFCPNSTQALFSTWVVLCVCAEDNSLVPFLLNGLHKIFLAK